MTGLLSLVIPTIGRPGIAAVLAALRRQESPGPFEILVVTDGGPPLDVRGVDTHRDCRRLVGLAVSRRAGVSVARNLGAARAEGAVLGFLDDDTWPDPWWVRNLRLGAHDGQVAAAVGRIRQTPAGPLSRLRGLAYDHRHAVNLAAPASLAVARTFGLSTDCGRPLAGYLSGGNCWVRTAAFAAVDGFDPGYLVGQDRELALRLLRAGLPVAYQPDLVVTHHGTGSVCGMVRGRYRSGRSAALMGAPRTGSGAEVARSTYGQDIATIARASGLRVGALALLSGCAYRVGYLAARRARPTPLTPIPPPSRRSQS